MHPDRKIGIAMGILLVGVVAALFFRNEPLPANDGLSLQLESEINQRLRDRDVTVFLGDADKDADQSIPTDQPWSLDGMLGELQTKEDKVPIPIGGHGLPLVPVEEKAEEPKPQPAGASGSVAASESRTGTEPESEIDFIEYTVEFGDTLSGISQRFLGSQSRFREIYEANKDRMDSPDRLRVGKAIRIPRVIR